MNVYWYSEHNSEFKKILLTFANIGLFVSLVINVGLKNRQDGPTHFPIWIRIHKSADKLQKTPFF